MICTACMSRKHRASHCPLKATTDDYWPNRLKFISVEPDDYGLRKATPGTGVAPPGDAAPDMLPMTANAPEIPQIFHNTYYAHGMTEVQYTLFTAPRAHAKPWERT